MGAASWGRTEITAPIAAMTTTTDVGGTGYGSPYLDSLILGWAWPQDGTILYYFDSNFRHPHWTPTEENAFRQALDLYENVTTLHFVETSDRSQANFIWQKWTGYQLGDQSILGEHEYPIPGRHSGANLQIDGYFNYQTSSWAQLQQGGDGFITIIHELGHGLGLEHPHDGEQVFPGVRGAWSTGTYGLNQGIWTTMSYNGGWDQRPTPSLAYGGQGTPMAFDIAALQAIYGANTTYHDGDDVYQLATVNGKGTFWSCLWDAGGTDTISNDGSSLACTIDLRAASLQAKDPHAGGYVSADAGIIGGFTIANNVVIEDAAGGSGNDNLIGNDADNRLEGGAGNDTIDGRGGADTMIGGSGDDTYFVDSAGDSVQEVDGGGTDTVNTTLDYALTDFIEKLKAIGGVLLTGNALNNTITGNALANTIDGLGGADIMTGSSGNDTYIVDDTGDRVIEAAGGGTDTVKSSVTFVLPANVENLILTGHDPIDGTGNSQANTITGNDAANTLNGGTGADHLNGGDGNDTYVIDNVGDTITEASGEGVDTIKSSIGHTIESEVENLVLTGSKAINATGNGLGNDITGNRAANILNGGTGADTMSGLAGNDTYFIDDIGDVVAELPGGGTDTVKSTITATLSDNVENLILLGSLDIDGTGNSLNNTLTGNSGTNTLDGASGNDTMIGGAGDDTYFVGSSGDKVIESANRGTDAVISSISYTLTTNVENLTLVGINPINGTGTSAVNIITGNDGANILDGNAGADHLTGGDGDDTYIVDNTGDVVTEAAGQGLDTIKSSVSHTLESEVENLTLTGTGAINGTGNDLDNVMIGNSASNVLDGGLGADTMKGLGGSDTYIVDNIGDVVVEAASGGTDAVKASIDYTLGANIERLTLTGSDPLKGTGNTLANILTGNDGANVLDGQAGADTLRGGLGDDTLTGGIGADVLSGGTGADIFHFNSLTEKGDTITDFLGGTDLIEMVAAGFAGALAGVVNLVSNASPHASATAGTFLFDTDNGRLSWDDDGNGAHAAQLLATLSQVHSLTAGDILIV
jgi:Ca2+-binding RTX toxin-like protein